MNSERRKAFERQYPVPSNCKWSEELEEYVWSGHPRVTHPYHNELWLAWCDGADYAKPPSDMRSQLFRDWTGCNSHGCIVTGPKTGMGHAGLCSCVQNARRDQLVILGSRLGSLLNAEESK